MTLRALVTRPEDDAAPLAAALAERGIDVTVEPLLAIRPIPDADIDLDGVQALLFTSANGVRSFAELAGTRDLVGWQELPVFAVGNATAEASRSAGFTRVESAAGDVAALARLVAERLDPQAGALFHAAGSAVAGDLAGLLEQAGFTLRRAMLYEAKPADHLSPATVTNLANGWFDLVLFFSPRTAATFVALARAAGDGVVAGCGRAAALCLSPAVAAAAGELTWREVQAAQRPELPALLDLIDRELALRARSTGAGEIPGPPPAFADAGRTAAAPRRSRLISIIVTAAATAAIVAVAAELLRIWSGDIAGTDPALLERLTAAEQNAQFAASSVSALTDQVGTMNGQVSEVRDYIADMQDATQSAQTAPSAPPVDTSALTKRLDALDGEIAALRAAPATPSADVAALNGRMNQLEAKIAALGTIAPPQSQAAPSTQISALTDKIAALESQLSALQARQQSTGPAVDMAAIERLSGENAQLRGDLAALKTQLEAVNKALAERGQDAGGVAVVLAVGNLGAALSTSRPFAAELAALADLSADDPALAAQVKELTAPIAARAAAGVLTQVELQNRFPATARAIVDAARESTPAPEADSGSKDWSERGLDWLSAAGDWLSSQVRVRPVGDVAGDDPGARVARAEVRLSEGALAAAVKELEGLSGPAAAAASGWLDDARARLAVDQMIAALQAEAATRLGSKSATTTGAGG